MPAANIWRKYGASRRGTHWTRGSHCSSRIGARDHYTIIYRVYRPDGGYVSSDISPRNKRNINNKYSLRDVFARKTSSFKKNKTKYDLKHGIVIITITIIMTIMPLLDLLVLARRNVVDGVDIAVGRGEQSRWAAS